MDSRILGIVGGVLLLIGVFCPLIFVEPLSLNISYIGSGAGTSWEGLLLILLGIAAIALAVLRKYKLLLVPGLIALAIIAYDYFSFKSKMSEMMSGAGSRSAELENAVQMKWGWIVLILGALVLLVAGAMGRNLPAPGTAYGAPPPPPAYPGR
jgi:hypothetical protein